MEKTAPCKQVIQTAICLSDGFNKNINKFGGIFHEGGGGSTHSTKIVFIFEKKYNDPSN